LQALKRGTVMIRLGRRKESTGTDGACCQIGVFGHFNIRHARRVMLRGYPKLFLGDGEYMRTVKRRLRKKAGHVGRRGGRPKWRFEVAFRRRRRGREG